MTFPEYLVEAEHAIGEERQRATQCVGPHFASLLEQRILDVAIKDKQEQLLSKDTGVRYLIVNNKEEDLARAYRLYSQVENGLTQIAATFNAHVRESGMAVISAKEASVVQSKKETAEDPEFIEKLVKVLNYFEGMGEDANL